MTAAICLKTESDLTMTNIAGDKQHSILLDGQAQNPGLQSLRECFSRSYSQARWLYELPGIAKDPHSVVCVRARALVCVWVRVWVRVCVCVCVFA
jgi:hypothetical protein